MGRGILLNLPDIMTAANVLLLISNIPCIRSVIKNRSVIAGYSVLGSGLTLAGMALVDYWYILMGRSYYLPFAISLTTDIYWGLAFTFSFKRWWGYNHEKN